MSLCAIYDEQEKKLIKTYWQYKYNDGSVS